MTTEVDQLPPADGRAPAWRRYTWAGGLVFVVALLAEAVISGTIPVNQNDSAAKIARALSTHRDVAVAVACVSMVYAVAFLVYLWRLHDMFRQQEAPGARLSTLVLVGGVLFLTLHAVSDIGITGMLGGKVAAYGPQHD